ncbi:alpha/beta hydrolase [bacterium]|nr:alpha/beta hydrolase [bacterium]
MDSADSSVASGQAGMADINGNQLRYRLTGEGPLVVFGHGLLGRIEDLQRYFEGLDPLLAQVRLLAYDARGHGESGGPESPAAYTWETLGRDMSSMIGFAGRERAIVGGVSMGAASAIWLAVERPERVKALVAMMPPPLGFPAMRTPGEQRAITALDFLASAVENYGIETAIEVVKAVPGFGADAGDADERAAWLRSQNPLTLKYAIRGLIDATPHDPECYSRIKVPTIVFGHEGDDLHPMRAAKLLADRVPGSHLLEGPTADYWMTHKDEVLRELEGFLARVG